MQNLKEIETARGPLMYEHQNISVPAFVCTAWVQEIDGGTGMTQASDFTLRNGSCSHAAAFLLMFGVFVL